MGEREEKKFELLKNQVHLLSHSFDAVQIFGTAVNEEGETVSYCWGKGNHNARYGQVIRWVCEQDRLDAMERDGE